jgi:hypothetical protein
MSSLLRNAFTSMHWRLLVRIHVCWCPFSNSTAMVPGTHNSNNVEGYLISRKRHQSTIQLSSIPYAHSNWNTKTSSKSKEKLIFNNKFKYNDINVINGFIINHLLNNSND